ncbi:hypothetical protein DQ04_08001000 [Trypanosoma grayi]|uniref:hypothetical protein n=1 Tax=Trypanosoma grayi TaxID=71804 RepID=UPI0004F4B685|nr:hypothetical protein DQ04_08001000 [Trypanosoma grayi]KEG08100.1 hypothetical protein DQ04_08001000 [Trypanosoma grayi]
MVLLRRVVWVLAAALCCTSLCVTSAAAENAVLPPAGTREAAQAKVAACTKDLSNAQALLQGAEEAYAKADEAKREVDNFTAKATKAKKSASEAESMSNAAVKSIAEGLEALKKAADAGTETTAVVTLGVGDLKAAAGGAQTAANKANSAAVKASEAVKLLEEATEHAKNVRDRAEKLGEGMKAEVWKNAVKSVGDAFSREGAKTLNAEAALKLAVKTVNKNKKGNAAANLFFSARMMAEQIGLALTNIKRAEADAKLAETNAKNAAESATEADEKPKTETSQEGTAAVTEKVNKAATDAKTNAESAEKNTGGTAQSIDNALKVAEVVKELTEEAWSSADDAKDAAKKKKDGADAALVEAEEELKKFTKVEKPESQLPEAEEPPTDHKSSEAEATVPLPTDQPPKSEKTAVEGKDQTTTTPNPTDLVKGDSSTPEGMPAALVAANKDSAAYGSDIPAWVRAPLLLLLLLACVAVW